MALSNAEIEAIMDQFDAGEYDLETALNEIATMQKGEDVRKAIYAGIMLANQAGSGTIDTIARRRLQKYQINVDNSIWEMKQELANFLATYQGGFQATKIVETTLFGSATSNTANRSATLSVSDDVNNYDYIDVRYAAFGRTGLVRIKPIDIATGAHWSEFEESEAGTGSTPLRKVSYTLSRSDASTLALSVTVWRWSGVASEAGNVTSIGQTWTVGIYSITGVKYQAVDTTEKDTELIDLRTTNSGAIMESAGMAVRYQISALQSYLNTISDNYTALEARVAALEANSDGDEIVDTTSN